MVYYSGLFGSRDMCPHKSGVCNSGVQIRGVPVVTHQCWG